MTAISPYPGLRPFRYDEADIFFGREEQIDQMLYRLESHRSMAVVGTSGCGKSSLVRAGLIPALEQGLLSGAGPDWRIAVMRPENVPFENLTAALLAPGALARERGGDSRAASFLQATLRRGPLGLREAIRESQLPPGTNVLLVVDQFEEIFRYRGQIANINDADAFVNLLVASAPPFSNTSAPQETPIFIVITMRSDFIGDCALFTGLPELISETDFLTPKMSRGQYQAAMVEPARQFGWQLEPDLVNRLLNDLGDSPDQLPRLQHALMRMWTRANSAGPGTEKLLRVNDYEAVGGLAEALSRHADEALNELTEEQQGLAQTLFRCLSERSPSKRDTRRPVKLKEAAAVAGVDIPALRPVVEAFRHPDRSFIMPPAPTPVDGETVLDISHESLISHWSKLNDWVEQEAGSASIYLRLIEATCLNQESEADFWLVGRSLERTLEWRQKEHPNSAWAARYGGDFKQAMDFLEASLTERNKQSQREWWYKFWYRFSVAAVLAVLIALGFVVYERTQSNKVKVERDRSNITRLALQSERDRDTSPDRSLLEALEAVQLGKDLVEKTKSYTDELNTAEESLRRALGTMGSAILSGHEAPIFRMAVSRDRQWLASVSRDRTIGLWDLQSRTLRRSLKQDNYSFTSVAFSPDVQWLAAGVRDASTVFLWEMKKLQNPPDLDAEPERLVVYTQDPQNADQGFFAVTFSPDSRTLAAGSGEGAIRLWEMDNRLAGPRLLMNNPQTDRITALAFNADGWLLASASQDRTACIWKSDQGWNSGHDDPSRCFGGHKSGVTAIAFSTSLDKLASSDQEGAIYLWDANPSVQSQALKGHEDSVTAIAWQDDSRLVSASRDGSIRLWDTTALPVPAIEAKLQPKSRIFIHKDPISALALLPDGNGLFFASLRDRVIRLWDLAKPTAVEPLILWDLDRPASAVFFQPPRERQPSDHFWLVFASANKILRWDLTGQNREPEVLGQLDKAVKAFAATPDGSKLVTVNVDSAVQLWDLTKAEPVEPQRLKTADGADVTAAAFSPDGHALATGGKDGTVRLWNPAEPTAESRLAGTHEAAVTAVAFSLDGHALAAGDIEGTVRLWNPADPRAEPRILVRHTKAVTAVAFSPSNAALLATASRDGRVLLWHLTDSHAEPQIFEPENKVPVLAIALSRDGKTLASAGMDNLVRLWDVAKASAHVKPLHQARVLPGHTAGVLTIAFSPDGRLLASGGMDRAVFVWRTQLDDIIQLACQYVPEIELSAKEIDDNMRWFCQQYTTQSE